MKTSDREAMGKLYLENWNDNPYKSDVEALKKHQIDVDRESGRIQPNPRSNTFEDDPENMTDHEPGRALEDMKFAWVRAILAAKKYNDNSAQGILRSGFISWAKDNNLTNDPDVREALDSGSTRARPWDGSGGFGG
jgi:ABC-type transport system substrate-binding protein